MGVGGRLTPSMTKLYLKKPMPAVKSMVQIEELDAGHPSPS